MGKYFGTDGFRGLAGRDLCAEHAFVIGRILGWMARENTPDTQNDSGALGTPDEQNTSSAQNTSFRPRILVGKDTRRSGYMLESALAAGITASGVDACLMHVTTTPSVAYITRIEDFSFGVMISASHNPYFDNGIKVLSQSGEKLDRASIDAIEALMDGNYKAIPQLTGKDIGCVVDYKQARDNYAQYLASIPTCNFKGKKFALDCANGGSYKLASKVFEQLGAEIHVINNKPDGLNINVECGSTHPEGLCDYVREHNLDAGFAFDGDADRCLAVDEQGKLVTGDEILYVCGTHMKKEGKLANNTVVTTIMSNFGLYKAFDACGVSYEKTQVGDKYVWENMRENKHMLGGEQSGHIIFGHHAKTGDGILSALKLAEVMTAANKPLSELCAGCVMYPQVLKNVQVDSKDGCLVDECVQKAIEAANKRLGNNGRTLVRKSGTEPVIRVMAEAPDHETCEALVDDIIEAMRTSGHLL